MGFFMVIIDLEVNIHMCIIYIYYIYIYTYILSSWLYSLSKLMCSMYPHFGLNPHSWLNPYGGWLRNPAPGMVESLE